MSLMQEGIVKLIKKPPNERSSKEVQMVLPWLSKNNHLLQGLDKVDKGILSEIIKGCSYQTAQQNDIVIFQGDQGDCMYIILAGKCGVYIDASKTGEDDLVSATASEIASAYNTTIKHSSSNGKAGPHLTVPAKQVHGVPKEVTSGANDIPEDAAAVAGLDGAVSSDLPVVSIEKLMEGVELEEKPDVKERGFNAKDYGRYIISFNTGCCFGELALISEQTTRNATIIAEEDTDLLVVSQKLYNKTLKNFQEAEYRAKKEFVSKSPLFRRWQPRFQRLLEMSLIKEYYAPGSAILTQGKPANGLIFILSGQAKITVEPGRHPQQYKRMTPFILDSVSEGLAWIRGTNKKPKQINHKHEEQKVRVKAVDIKRKSGYAAAEKMKAEKIVPLCIVGTGEVLGDVECVMHMKTNMQTVTATDVVEGFLLNAKNYERLLSHRNRSTIELLKMTCETKLENRLRRLGETEVPLFKHILLNMRRVERPPTRDEIIQLSHRKQLPDRETLFKHLASSFSKNRAELIEPIVTGSVYIRDVMREKAKEREHMRTVRKQPKLQRKKKMRLQRPKAFPRSNKQLIDDLEKQHINREKRERSSLIKNIRHLEMMDVKEEVSEAKGEPDSLPYLSVLQSVQEADRTKILHLLKQELGIEVTITNDLGEEKDTKQQETVLKDNVTGNKKVKKLCNKQNKEVTNKCEESQLLTQETPDVQKSVPNDLTLQEERTRSFITQLRPGSEPDLSREHSHANAPAVDKTGSGRVRSAKAEVRTDAHNKYILPMIPPAVQLVSEAQKQKETNRTETQAKIKVLNNTIRQRLHMALENPAYRDWETSDSSIAHLESRIAKFYQRQARILNTAEPKCLPKLTRFMTKNDEKNQPKPGGKVYVRRRECPLKTSEFEVINHNHIRMHMVPELKDYATLRRSRLLMQFVVDEIRTSKPPPRAKAK